ncbi:hypothetical protein KKZ47_10885 [Enterobacter hormaechei subsp. xiangfangensis]|nr:hypothetical protein [Enterobacter hormaechei subsp. xiangfangensis]
MANSRYDVEINADNKGLSAAVNNSMEELNKLDSVANGLFSNLTGPLNNLKGGIDGIKAMSPALMGLGAAGLAASAGLMTINRTKEVVGTLNQISETTGVSIEMLQKLEKEFRITGMSVEEFGDINKDAMDKLGDSIRENGGGIADDLEKWGIELDSLKKYAYEAEGGVKAVVDVFYQMKQAGRSQAEIVNAMESMASNSSHLISTLEKHTNAQDALNSINKQAVPITQDISDEVKRFDENMKQLQINTDAAAVTIGGPLIESMNDLWAFMNKDWSATDYMAILDMITGGAYKLESNTRLAQTGWTEEMEANYQKDIKAAKAKASENNRILQERKRQAEKAANDEKDRQKKIAEDQEKAKKEADKTAKEREQAAAKAKAEYDKMMQQRASYLQTMSQLDIAIVSQEARGVASQMNQMQQTLSKIDELQEKGIISLEQANFRRNQLMTNSAKEFKDSLTFNADDIGKIAAGVEQAYQMQVEQAGAKLKQGLVTKQEYNAQMEQIEQDHQSRMAAIQDINANNVNTKNLDALGFATDDQLMELRQQQLKDQIDKFHESNQSMYDNGLLSHEQFLKQKETLDKAYSVKSKAISLAEIQTKTQMYDGFAQGMSGIISGIAGENSKAAQAAFAVAKGTSIATGMLHAYESATTAMAKYPGPLGYALAASSYASVIGQVMNMKSVSPVGMAHDGIDNVPTEGTWLLDGGERVVDQRTNEDLKSFLNHENKGQSQPIDASIHINGNVTDQRWFAEQLKKHQKTVASIVQDQNRRKL